MFLQRIANKLLFNIAPLILSRQFDYKLKSLLFDARNFDLDFNDIGKRYTLGDDLQYDIKKFTMILNQLNFTQYEHIENFIMSRTKVLTNKTETKKFEVTKFEEKWVSVNGVYRKYRLQLECPGNIICLYFNSYFIDYK